MRASTLITAVSLIAVGAAFGAFAQERVKAKSAADFDTVHADVKKHFKAGHFGKAFSSGKTLLSVIGDERAGAVRKALPDAPPEHEKVAPKKDRNRQNAMLASMVPGAGNVLEQIYLGPNGQIKTTVMADSPYISMFNMVTSNPAMLPDNQELIKYGSIMAILETNGKRKNLKILIDDSMVETAFPNHDDDFVFAMWNQEAVDKVATAIRN